jgi:hypothetical protein
MARADTQALNVARLAEDIAYRLPDYIDNAEAAYLATDGRPDGAIKIVEADDGERVPEPRVSGGAGPGPGGSTTENAALRRLDIEDRVRRIRATLGTIRRELGDILDAVQRDARRADEAANGPTVTPRCSPVGRDGWDIPRPEGWADPACRNIPERGPLCIPCYHRERRYRDRHDLPARYTPKG